MVYICGSIRYLRLHNVQDVIWETLRRFAVNSHAPTLRLCYISVLHILCKSIRHYSKKRAGWFKETDESDCHICGHVRYLLGWILPYWYMVWVYLEDSHTHQVVAFPFLDINLGTQFYVGTLVEKGF